MQINCPSVLLIYTGGTIGMIENPETGALENFNFDHLLKHVPELKRFNYHISSYQFNPPIDSSDMEPAFWAKIVKIISYNYDYFDGFVILHGTDTMAFTASALSFMLENLHKPVILTGSQLPLGMLRTDGKENLITAIEIASARDGDVAMIQEVCIFFENDLMRGNRTSKTSADNFNAFHSYNYPALAHAGISIHYNLPHIYRPVLRKPLKPHFEFDNHIAILKLFTNGKEACPEDVIEALRPEYGHFKALNKADVLTALRLPAGDQLANRLDFSLVSDMSYYSSLIFRGYLPGLASAVLSGGRYDNLLRKMGKSAGAIGFAVYLDLLERLDTQEPDYDVDVLLLYREDTDPAAVAQAAQALFGGERPAVSVVVGVPPVDDGQGEPPMPAEASSSEKGEGQKDALDELLAFGEQFDNIVIQ